MTKEDYIAIAKILKNERRSALSDQDYTRKVRNIQITSIARALGMRFAFYDPQLDETKFVKSTNLTEEEKRLPL